MLLPLLRRMPHFNPRSPHGERHFSRMRLTQPPNFNPRSPHGERQPSIPHTHRGCHYFNPRSPHGERLADAAVDVLRHKISIHAPRTGSDWYRDATRTDERRFQSTLPARGATCPPSGRAPVLIYFNPRSPHGERHVPPPCVAECVAFQSTLPARGATASIAGRNRLLDISIHAPRTGSDYCDSYDDPDTVLFQSTLPARGATNDDFLCPPSEPISIHAPRTGSDLTCALTGLVLRISIHAPRTGSDATASSALEKIGTFQSTLPARGATAEKCPPKTDRRISIHAPRTGSDCTVAAEKHLTAAISIHAPRTGSDAKTRFYYMRAPFQSTLPARGATPRGGRTRRRNGDFNPRSPHGERRRSHQRRTSRRRFQSTLPARGATSGGNTKMPANTISIHAPRTGSDGRSIENGCGQAGISIHAPRTGSDAAKEALVRAATISIHAPRTGSDFDFCRTHTEK